MAGVDGELLEPLVEYFYTGKIIISNDNVLGLLQGDTLQIGYLNLFLTFHEFTLGSAHFAGTS